MKREESKPPEVAATLSLCCNIVRIGWRPAPEMHTMLCRDRHGGELGDTYYLDDSGMCWTEDGMMRPRLFEKCSHCDGTGLNCCASEGIPWFEPCPKCEGSGEAA